MIKLSILLYGLALASLSWLVWSNFFQDRPTIAMSGYTVFAVDSSSHAGVTFLVPIALLGSGLACQLIGMKASQ